MRYYLAQQIGPSDVNAPNVGLDQGIPRLLSLLFFFAGVLAVFFIIWGGFKYAISTGDPKNIQEAKEIIYRAIFGLIISMAAFAIVRAAFGSFG
jgi:hypothetical protein